MARVAPSEEMDPGHARDDKSWIGMATLFVIASVAWRSTNPAAIQFSSQRLRFTDDIVEMVRELPNTVAELKNDRELLIFGPWMLLLWPLTFGIGFKVCVLDDEGSFDCHRKHLVRLASPDAAQAEAKVIDPLGRTPELPFGHLNAGWCAFLAGRHPKDKLWYFEIPGYTPGPDDPPQRHRWSVPQGGKRGYAWVRSRKVRAEFVFEWD